MNNNKKVGVIITLYNTTQLNVELDSLPDNVVLIVVDNTEGQNLNISSNDRIIYKPLFENTGIAFAQNIGIIQAKASNCSFVIFLDQDSNLPADYIHSIVQEYKRISRQVPNLFLLGPTVYNGREQQEYKSTIHRDDKTEFDFIPRREIISSGSCFAIDNIDQIGLLDNNLFIDFVDFEWCWRANNKGFQCGVTSRVRLTHFVGQQEYRLLNQLVIISSPIRYYYQTRNYLWLLRRQYVPSSWKLNTGIKRLVFSLSYPFKIKNWKEIYRYTYKGFLAGIKGYKQNKNRNNILSAD